MATTPPNKSFQTQKVNWRFVRLGDYSSKIGSGSTPRGGEAVYVEKGVPLIRSMNVHFDGLHLKGLALLPKIAAEKLKSVTVQAEDVLLNITGASIGRVTTAPSELAGARVNQHVCIIRPAPALLPKFLAYFLATPVEQMRINQCQVGATRQALTKQMIENWRVPLPSVEEQQRIIAEIEKHLTRLEVGQAALRRVQANLKRYRASVLKAACEGHLVPTDAELALAEGKPFESGQQLLSHILTQRREEWQGPGEYSEPDYPERIGSSPLPKGWVWASIEQLRLFSRYGPRFSSDDYSDDGYFVLRTTDINEAGKVTAANAPRLQLSETDFAKYRIKRGDLLVTRTGSLGTLAVFNDDVEAIPGAYLIQFRLSTGPITARYIFYFLKSPSGQSYLTGKGAGIAQLNLNAPTIEAMRVPFPPLAEQTRIVSEIERRLSVVEELNALVSVNIQRGKRLRGSILNSEFGTEASSEQQPQQAKIASALDRQTVKQVKQTIFPMKKQVILTPKSLVEIVRCHKGNMTPSDLCLASNVEEEVEAFFEILRECRNQGLLKVPSGVDAIIKLAKP